MSITVYDPRWWTICPRCCGERVVYGTATTMATHLCGLCDGRGAVPLTPYAGVPLGDPRGDKGKRK